MFILDVIKHRLPLYQHLHVMLHMEWSEEKKTFVLAHWTIVKKCQNEYFRHYNYEVQILTLHVIFLHRQRSLKSCINLWWLHSKFYSDAHNLSSFQSSQVGRSVGRSIRVSRSIGRSIGLSVGRLVGRSASQSKSSN